jgi:hypothetical protein
VPVLVLDVDESEAAKILATLDPLAAMAGADAGKLDELLRDVKTGSAALDKMLARLAAETGVVTPPLMSNGEPPQPAGATEPAVPTKFAIVVSCESEEQQLTLLEQFETEGLECRALVV